MNNTDKVKRKFQQGELKYLDAIEVLQSLFGFSSLEAESEVERWETDTPPAPRRDEVKE